MNDREVRLVHCLALVPMTVILCAVLWTVMYVAAPARAFYLAAGVTSLAIPLLAVLIWGRWVSVPRPWVGTVGLGLLMTSVVCLAIHACFGEAFLRLYSWWDGPNRILFAGQCLFLGGLTWLVALCALLPAPAAPALAGSGTGVKHVTPDARRLAIGIALVPLLSGLWWFWFLVDQRVWSAAEDMSLLRAYEVCGAVMVIAWILLWRKRVRWTPGVILSTTVLATVTLAIPLLLLVRYAIPTPAGPLTWRQLTWFAWGLLPAAPVFAAVLWLCGSAWLWRRPADLLRYGDTLVNSDVLTRCPACLYSLRGLRETRCPECGWSATLDELVERGLARLQGGV